jgi:hypothetical protein
MTTYNTAGLTEQQKTDLLAAGYVLSADGKTITSSAGADKLIDDLFHDPLSVPTSDTTSSDSDTKTAKETPKTTDLLQVGAFALNAKMLERFKQGVGVKGKAAPKVKNYRNPAFVKGGSAAERKAHAIKLANMSLTGKSAADRAAITKARQWYTGQTKGGKKAGYADDSLKSIRRGEGDKGKKGVSKAKAKATPVAKATGTAPQNVGTDVAQVKTPTKQVKSGVPKRGGVSGDVTPRLKTGGKGRSLAEGGRPKVPKQTKGQKRATSERYAAATSVAKGWGTKGAAERFKAADEAARKVAEEAADKAAKALGDARVAGRAKVLKQRQSGMPDFGVGPGVVRGARGTSKTGRPSGTPSDIISPTAPRSGKGQNPSKGKKRGVASGLTKWGYRGK